VKKIRAVASTDVKAITRDGRCGMSGRRIMRGVGAALAIGLLATGAGGMFALRAEAPPTLAPQRQAELAGWLRDNGLEPTAYVTGRFDDHDVVFLGEMHRIRHDVEFVQSLLAPLHARGVRVLATEFGRREDQADIDALLGAPEWNETLAREITFRQFVWWGFQEYVDVYRAAWELNRSLPDWSPPFRIIGVNDSPDWSFIETQADRDRSEIKRRVWRGGSEKLWAQAILDAVADGEKVLVHCGLHHAFTAYRQPIVIDGAFSHFDRDLRCGNHVYAALGERTMTICLHAPWSGAGGYGDDLRHPADGVIDALMLAVGPRPVGFDLDGGPFGELHVVDAVYRHGYDDFRLADLCDGWIYTRPISRYEGMTPIPGWINDANLARARAQSPNPAYREGSCEAFNLAVARDAKMAERWANRLR
jgi:hypothetical protein